MEWKYLSSPRKCALDQPIPNRPCSRIWSLCKKFVPFLRNHNSKVPLEGHSTDIWNEKIMGNPPLANDLRLLRIQLHLGGLGINTLNQISCWKENNSHLDGWLFPNLPPYLHNDRLKLASMINGAAPLARGEEDNFRWDPTRSPYSIRAGYEILLGETYPSLPWATWK